MPAGFWLMTKPAKASLNVKTGDIIEIQFGMKSVKVEVLDVARDGQEGRKRRIFIVICEF